MKLLRDLFGYLLGLLLFVGLMPALMWLASGMPKFWTDLAGLSGRIRRVLMELAGGDSVGTHSTISSIALRFLGFISSAA